MKNNLSEREWVKYQAPWRNYYIGINLRAVRTASTTFLAINVILRAIYSIFNVTLSNLGNFQEVSMFNWIFLFSSLLFSIINEYLLSVYKKTTKATVIMSLFTFSFSLYIIISGMCFGFVTVNVQRNALIFYLFALITVGVLLVHTNLEAMILAVLSEILFTVMLIIHGLKADMLYYQVISILLLGGFCGISRFYFITRLKYFQRMMESHEKNLEIEHASEQKSRLLNIVAHDLRNPIAAVETIATMMEMDEQTDDNKENIAMIKTSCEKARGIIEDLLETARNEHVAEFVAVKTELNLFLSQLIEVWKVQKQAAGLMLMSRVNPAYVNINYEKFQRVIDNLIGNALKFSPENSKIVIILRKKGSDIIVEIKDHGMGIPKDKLPIIFDPFTKAGRPGLRGELSTGLGLSIVKQIVEKHKGNVEVESEEGKGSTFRMLLPEA